MNIINTHLNKNPDLAERNACEGRNGRVAVLIDGENISPSYATMILGKASEYGTVITQYVYGDYSRSMMDRWDLLCPEYLLERRHCRALVAGKNASDHYLVIDAMKMIFSGQYGTIVIASSDSDYTELACEIRRAGMIVIGMGEAKSSQVFRKAFDEFVVLNTEPAAEPAESYGKDRGQLSGIIGETYDQLADGQGWCLVSHIGVVLHTRIEDFDCRRYESDTLSDLLQSLGYEIGMRARGSGKACMVRRNSEAVFTQQKSCA